MTDQTKTSDVSRDEELVSEDRRAALRAIGKYATLGAGASFVVLSSADAVNANPRSNICSTPGGSTLPTCSTRTR